MLDEVRSHSAQATEEERAWIATDPFAVVGRVALMTAVAVMIGVTGSQLLDTDPAISFAAAPSPTASPASSR